MDISKVQSTAIQNDKTNKSQEAEKQHGTQKTGAEQITDSKNLSQQQHSEKVQWSEDAQMMNRALDIAKNSPDVRADKVAQLKAAIQSGSYKVDAHSLAEKMIQSNLEDDLSAFRS